jgi:hypothetical protein
MTTPSPTTIEELLDYWPGNIPFKGKLVSDDGCMCAQGQALHFLKGLTVDELLDISQGEADEEVAELFGISVTHSILLRIINDTREGAPSCVIRNPEQILGDQAQMVLAFWWHIDRVCQADWQRIGRAVTAVAGEKAIQAAAAVAEEAAAAAAGMEASQAAWLAASRGGGWRQAVAKAGATNEIQGAARMRANNQPFFFLPLFGFANPQAVIAAQLEVQSND